MFHICNEFISLVKLTTAIATLSSRYHVATQTQDIELSTDPDS